LRSSGRTLDTTPSALTVTSCAWPAIALAMLGLSTSGDAAAGPSGVADGCGKLVVGVGDEDAAGVVVVVECGGRVRR
jgi:hypothetical protein